MLVGQWPHYWLKLASNDVYEFSKRCIMAIKTDISEYAKVELGRSPAANTAIGLIGGGIGAAAISATFSIVLPFMLAGGLAGYLLTNRIPSQ
jgi:hypothetical protein